MVDADEVKLKAEIDAIAQQIQDTMKKIEQVVPLKSETSEQSEANDQQNQPSPQESKNQL
jgi:hypothetical protein